MFGRKPKKEFSKLDDAIDNVLNGMDTHGADSQKYADLLGYLERLSALRKSEDKKRVSPDQVLSVAGYLFGILILVAYEQKHTVTSKAMGLIRKP